ncbi:IbrB-like domain-containing protein [Methylorubrum extorquens]|uniref:ParB domain protein nuclease n=1 Tax=Methylorubrum extorquens DSM 13060 TaxID=882800 RepID=H1KS19_METEX|nr:ParB/RepB/Spo0J family partition protein [Methylorubrum extorquens]EHP89586.1 ParB domain protein nuclease [Methylorubrum extorquens DSM 13060]
MTRIEALTAALAQEIAALPLPEKVEALNAARRALHEVSPFRSEPVDLVTWIPNDRVTANEYNPNKIASTEMQLLHRSIKEDGYTQPIVTFPSGGGAIVVDGFHRHRVGKEKADVRERVHGYLPVVGIDKPLAERMASTVRHNRARGKHQVDLMSEMVVKLVNLGQSDQAIARQLGLSADELIRLKAQTGIAALFANQPFSRSWIAVDGEDAAVAEPAEMDA